MLLTRRLMKKAIYFWRKFLFRVLYRINWKVKLLDFVLGRTIIFKLLQIVFFQINLSAGRKKFNSFIVKMNLGNHVLMFGFKEYNYYQTIYNKMFARLTIAEPFPDKDISIFVDETTLIQDYPIGMTYDSIQCIGIYGYGLNKKEDLIKSFSVLSLLLKDLESVILFSINYERDYLDLRKNISDYLGSLKVRERISTGDGEILLLSRIQ